MRILKREHTDARGARLPYRLILPPPPRGARGTGGRALLLFLHGIGERGRDNRRQLVHGKEAFLAAAKEYDCVVVAPQCPREIMWGDPRMVQQLKDLLDLLRGRERIDTQRIFVTGLSMGGNGTWELLARYPSFFAAAAPICGWGDPSKARRFAHVPVWAFHGADDQAVLVGKSREMVGAMRAAGGRPRLTVYPKTGHDSWTVTYNNPKVWQWLFKQERGCPPRGRKAPRARPGRS